MAMTAWAAKFCHQRYLFVGEGLNLMAREHERSDDFVVLEQRHHEGRPYAAKFDAHNGAGRAAV